MKYLIVGKMGQLGREFVKEFTRRGDNFAAFAREQMDVSENEQVARVFDKERPDVVINCTAYNDVDGAEKDICPANRTNVIGIGNLISSAKKHSSFLIHYSTDYVFDGISTRPYSEDDIPNPLNNYAKSKFAGENSVCEELNRFLLFRVSWVYGHGDQNFIRKFLNWSSSKKELKIAVDEVSIPTPTRLIVELTLAAFDAGLTGLYHLVPSGYCSRYDWAEAIKEILRLNVALEKCSKELFCLPAKRPGYSVLSNQKLLTALSITVPDWKDELKRFLSK